MRWRRGPRILSPMPCAVAPRPSAFACRAAARRAPPIGCWRRRNDIAWDCVEIFFGDERLVPPDHPDSNYRMARETLLAGGTVQPRALLAMPTDGTPQSCADAYEEILRQQYGASTLDPEVPLFDLMLLGLGADGHTASLLPGQPVLKEKTRWVAPVPEGPR